MKFLWLVIPLFLLSGCANDMVDIPLSSMTTEESRVAAYSTIGDTSTAKEAIVHKSWQTYYREYEQAYQASGMTMSYQEITLSDGSKAHLPVINYRPPPTMAAPPSEPSQHPVWRTVDNVINKGIMWAGIGWIAHEWRGMQESAYDAAGNTYNGPTNMKGSYNTAGNDNYVTMNGTQNTNTGAENNQTGCPNGECGEEEEIIDGSCGEGSFEEGGTWWIEPGCSCTSRAAGSC